MDLAFSPSSVSPDGAVLHFGHGKRRCSTRRPPAAGLQKEIPPSDRDAVAACEHLERVSLDDFAATAEQVSGLDLVISVDTSVAHLAGALNVPVWILLAKASELALAAGSRQQPLVSKRTAVPTTTSGRLTGSRSTRQRGTGEESGE